MKKKKKYTKQPDTARIFQFRIEERHTRDVFHIFASNFILT